MNLEQLIQMLSPEALNFVTQLADRAMQGDAEAEETLNLMVEIAQTEGVPALEQAIQEFQAQQQPQGDPAMDAAMQQPPVSDPAMGATPGMEGDPAMDAAMGLPPGGAAMPPAGMDPMAGGMPAGASPPSPATPIMPEQPKPKKKKVPKYNPPPVKKVTKPTLNQIREDARAGRDYWAPRDQRMRDDYALYLLEYDNNIFGLNRNALTLDGVVIHKRSQPNTLVNLVTGLVTAKNDKLNVELEPRSEGDEYQEASQNSEDFVTYSRECDEERWLEERINEPPLPRKEAGLAALEGGIGWTWYVDADDEEHPIKYELVPLSQLYDVGHACTRQYTMPLSEARRQYEQIREAYPTGGMWDANQLVRIIVHMDNQGVWKSIVWEDAGRGSRGNHDNGSGFASARVGKGGDATPANRDEWIMKPTRVNFGFRGFNYVVWGGSPGEALQGQERSNIAFKGHGVLTMLRKTFRLMDLFISAVATGALRAVDPAWVVTSDVADLSQIKPLDVAPNGFNRYPTGTDVKPLVWEISKNADAQALMNSLIAELADVQSPALSGAPGVSGVAQQVSTEQASQQVVGPMIDALEKWYGLMHKQRLILALRYSDDSKYNVDESGNEQTYFNSYQKKSYRGETWGQYGELKPADIHKSGVRVKVRYHDRNLQEEIGLSQMVSQLTQAHLMSQETALRRMGVKDPRREMERIFTDGAFMEPEVLKAIVERAVMESGDQWLIDAWNKAFYASMVAGSQGSQPAQPGMPSMPNQPGVNSTGSSSAVMAPNAQAQGMM